LKKNTLAIIAFIFSLLWLGPIAATFGHLSLAQIKKSNEGNRKLALVAVILGWVQTAVLVFFISNPLQFGYTLGFIWGTLNP
jgi:hypothetical protein